jgi:diphthine synthase
MFYLIGTGVFDYEDLTLKGLRLCKECDFVFIERYTSIFSNQSLIKLEGLIGNKIVELNRNDLESNFESNILEKAKSKNVALLIVGDPLTATTHIEFLRTCKANNVKFKVVHASSIYSSVCETGLHIYRFGKSCSIPYPEKNYKPTSFFDIIEMNHRNQAHSLVFLDIKHDLKKYMSISEALNILLSISKSRSSWFNENTEVIGIARLGSKDQIIKYGTVKELLIYDFGPNPHILIIPYMNGIERDYVTSLY